MRLIYFATLCAIAIVTQGTTPRGPEGDFNAKYYMGAREDSVVLVDIRPSRSYPASSGSYGSVKWCYGVLINWRRVLSPCSCVTYLTPGDKGYYTPFKQVKGDYQVRMMNPRGMRVYKISNYGIFVGVKNIQISSKCRNNYEVDFAMLSTSNVLKDSKLAWVRSNNFATFHEFLTKLAIGNSVTSNCEIYQRTIDRQQITGQKTPKTFRTRSTKITFQHWDFCRPLVCPEIMESDKFDPSREQISDNCFNINHYATRFCVGWKHQNALCNFDGAPIFCGEYGLVGMITNRTSVCGLWNREYAVLEGLSDALFLISDQLRIGDKPKWAEFQQRF